jgi:hypothetical protein
MAERFTGCDQLGGFAWARILSRRPEFADRCDKWDEMRRFGGNRQWDACGKFVQPL